jgi:uncharacterized membrane protein YesL
MRNAANVWWRTLLYIHRSGYLTVWGTLCWAVASLPILTAPAAWAGLVKMMHAAQTQPTSDLNVFWQGFRENLGRGLLLTLLNLVIISINVSNLIAYSDEPGVLMGLLRAIWLLALIYWFSIQLYLWPLFYEMREPSLWGALRNAALMVALNPVFTIGLWMGILLVAAISTILVALWVLVTGGVFATLASVAVLNRLQVQGLRPSRTSTATHQS